MRELTRDTDASAYDYRRQPRFHYVLRSLFDDTLCCLRRQCYALRLRYAARCRADDYAARFRYSRQYALPMIRQLRCCFAMIILYFFTPVTAALLLLMMRCLSRVYDAAPLF